MCERWLKVSARFSLCAALTTLFLAGGLLASPAAAAPSGPAKIQATSAAPTLLAQAWNQQQQQQQPVRLRAKSVIKFGLLIAAIIGGLISFLIRMGRGGSSQPQADGYSGSTMATTPGYGATTSGPGGEYTWGSSASVVQQPRRSSNAGKWLLIILGGMAFLFMFVVVAAIASWMMFVNSVRPADPGMSFEEAEAIFRSFDEKQNEAEREFEARWAKFPDAASIEQAIADPSDPAGDNPAVAENVPQAGDANVVKAKPGEAFPPLEAAQQPLRVDWKEADTVESGWMVTRQGMSFRDDAPEGGLLVGIRATMGRGRLESVQPIYQIDKQYQLGAVYGIEGEDETVQMLARDGFAVSAVRLDLGNRVYGLQLEFGPVVDGRIDTSQTYVSPFVGQDARSKAMVVEGQGDVFVGLSGSVSDGLEGLLLRRFAAMGSCDPPAPSWSGLPTSTLKPVGGESRNKFEDAAPDGGLLVGMRFFQGQTWGGAIRAVQPIYQVGDAYRVGRRHGPDGGVLRQVLARPGYAIGRLDTRAGLVMNSVQVSFHKITDNGLDPTDSYTAGRIGSQGGGDRQADSGGRPIVGLAGSFHHEITSLQLTVVETPSSQP